MGKEEFEELADMVRTEIIRIYYHNAQHCLTKDTLSRKMVCSPLLGEYGTQGYCFAIDGTPPRGTVFTFPSYDGGKIMFWDNIRFKNMKVARKYIGFCKMIDTLQQALPKMKQRDISNSFDLLDIVNQSLIEFR